MIHRDVENVPGPYLPEADWSFPDALYVFLAGQAVALIVAMVGFALDVSEFTLVAVSLTAQGIGSLGLAAWMSSNRGTGDWQLDFGLRIRPGHVWAIFVGFLLQLAVALVIGPIVELFAPDDAPQQGVADVAESLDGDAQSIVFLFLVVVIAPLIEELIFRGMLLSRLRRTMGKWSAITLSAAAFAVIHLIDPNAVLAVPSLFVVGVALAWAALRYGDLSVPIFLHAGVNLTGAILLIYGDELLEWAESVEAVLRGIG